MTGSKCRICLVLVCFSHELLKCKILSTAAFKVAFQSLPCLGKSVTGERAPSRADELLCLCFSLVICSPKSSQRSNNSVCLLCLPLRAVLGKAGLQAAPALLFSPSSDRFALAAFHRAQENPPASKCRVWFCFFFPLCHFFLRIFFFLLLGRISQSPRMCHVVFVSHEMHPAGLWECCCL